ncbi:hypothetical protein CC78DRAFT_530658 [Lojkania enalia]|uniref:Uncharacterized protein n=1 Tax=Lojkania enalia TaxID=147567 RepID=A0A9P4N5U9_9PLEO|nr:hypothetical protein CC78DRAFT_530658 [Didymosphaeria enalia]
MALRFARLPIPTRLPITPRPFLRHHSSASRAGARIVHIAAQAEKPSAAEAGLPVVWALCAGLGVAAWRRAECSGDCVEELLVV